MSMINDLKSKSSTKNLIDLFVKKILTRVPSLHIICCIKYDQNGLDNALGYGWAT